MKNFFYNGDIDEIVARLTPYADLMEGKTLLLTGARGFLGRYFCAVFTKMNEEILSSPLRILAVDNLITSGDFGKQHQSQSNIEFVECDITEKRDFGEKFDFIVHAAGIASPYYYRAYPLETIDVSVRGSRWLLELAREQNAKFTFFSSSEIYGDPDPIHIPTPESYNGNVPCKGARSCYDEGKRLGETLCHVFHTNFGVHTTAIRPFNVYGPGMQELDYRVLPNFASALKGGRPLKVYGSGNQTRTFCYITDAIVGFTLAILKGAAGESYNIGNPTPEISVKDLAFLINDLSGGERAVELIEYPDSYPADEPNRRCPLITKARIQLEYTPEVELKDGLMRFINWSDANYTGVQ